MTQLSPHAPSMNSDQLGTHLVLLPMAHQYHPLLYSPLSLTGLPTPLGTVSCTAPPRALCACHFFLEGWSVKLSPPPLGLCLGMGGPSALFQGLSAETSTSKPEG